MSAVPGEEVREQPAADVLKVKTSTSRQRLLGSRRLLLRAAHRTMLPPQSISVIPYRG